MKFDNDPSSFKPITIVVETEAEAQVLATMAGAMSPSTEKAITGLHGGAVSDALFRNLMQYYVDAAKLHTTSRKET